MGRSLIGIFLNSVSLMQEMSAPVSYNILHDWVPICTLTNGLPVLFSPVTLAIARLKSVMIEWINSGTCGCMERRCCGAWSTPDSSLKNPNFASLPLVVDLVEH